MDFLFLEEEVSEGKLFSTVFDLAQHSQSCLPGEKLFFFAGLKLYSDEQPGLLKALCCGGPHSCEKLGPLFSLLDEKSYTLNTNVHVYNISHILEINVQKYIEAIQIITRIWVFQHTFQSQLSITFSKNFFTKFE